MSTPEAEDLPHGSMMGLSRCPTMVSALYMTIRAWTESRLQMYPHTDAQQGMGKEEGPGLGGLLSAILQAC